MLAGALCWLAAEEPHACMTMMGNSRLASLLSLQYCSMYDLPAVFGSLKKLSNRARMKVTMQVLPSPDILLWSLSAQAAAFVEQTAGVSKAIRACFVPLQDVLSLPQAEGRWAVPVLPVGGRTSSGQYWCNTTSANVTWWQGRLRCSRGRFIRRVLQMRAGESCTPPRAFHLNEIEHACGSWHEFPFIQAESCEVYDEQHLNFSMIRQILAGMEVEYMEVIDRAPITTYQLLLA